ncbi:unnamed protein product [Rotaria sp. Silwood1]|nr:unnamed protein product [Rotaria sp. Silwood1]
MWIHAYFTGSLRGWSWMGGIMSCISNFVTVIVNNPDFTRFATRPSAAFWSQLLTIPIGFSVTCFIGVIVSSSSNVIFGQAIWNPLDLLGKFLDSQPSAGTRAGVFFISLAFALAQLGVNIAANSISAGSDLTALLPNPVPACGQKWPSEVVDDIDNSMGLKAVVFNMEGQNDSIKLQDQKVVDEVTRS